MSVNIPEIFACNVFNEEEMKTRLPKNVYKTFKKTVRYNEPLDMTTADVLANAIKEWAMEKGATHYTHWFQPMTGSTAEKHDSFITPGSNGMALMEFSGKALVKGEPDASSFPSGGLRQTSSARGYTAWDPTSYCFVKEGSLYIPTVFVSYTGEVLDKKTPLLRSMQALSKTAVRFLKLFGNDRVTQVTSTVGAEQEYFLIDKKMYDQREDLILTGRTLFGAKPPKGQELEDHYFGNIKERVAAYMHELDEELWKLGIPAKTKHNEVAPAQHELAPVFETANIASDHNQLTMELMKKIALKHGLVCLLHEKPFAGVNGSGKHNNWSIASNDGQNLLDPGDTPTENTQFLTFLVAFIKAVNKYSDLLRLSAASAGNDHRLGANEAPPAIVSMFIGDELQALLDALENDTKAEVNSNVKFKIGVDALPSFKKDNTDRNRTSPMAFTGNKFEFRMLGSADSISCTNVMMNTIVADVLCEFADELEGAKDFNGKLKEILVKAYKENKNIIFNGNGYSDEWVKEATEVRGLPNYVSTVDCLPQYLADKNVQMFEKFKIYSKVEIASRTEILLENYTKVINIEALTMVDMAKKQIYPAVMNYTKDVCSALASMKSVGIENPTQEKLANKLSSSLKCLDAAVGELEQALINAKDASEDIYKLSRFYRDEVFSKMQSLRAVADELETIVSEKYWPFPVYSDLLFRV